jgi:acid phosphatase family membrane protein YuiD
MNLLDVFQNKVLIAVMIAWLLAQVLKIPTEYLRSRRWMWAMFFAAGGHGHLWSEDELKEVIGHTPLEVVGGIILGLLVAILQWVVWP